ncbi:MAG: putative Ig domain-containing protein [Verrucomicrobia bacterium]|nr:putative Ig domain-containing protein [Verrucomicrobiota bacterium]
MHSHSIQHLLFLLAAISQLSALNPQLLRAQQAPLITAQPTNQYPVADAVVSFGVAATGDGPLSYQWRKDGTNLVDGGKITGAATASVTVSNVQTPEMGFYSVVVTNLYGAATSTVATLQLVPMAAWGNSWSVEATIPSGLNNVVAIAAGGNHNVALTAEGKVVAWGSFPEVATPPSGLSNVVAIAAGYSHSLALTTEGRVVGWGSNNYGQTNVPAGLSNVVAIAAGVSHSLALRGDGQVVGWGAGGPGSAEDPHYGQSTIPSGLSNVVAIAAGGEHSLALTAKGLVVAWGDNRQGQTTIPSGLSNVVAIAAGGERNLAMTTEGWLVGWGTWGRSSAGQTTIPTGLSNVVAISAAGMYSLALTAEGQVILWAHSSYGQTNIPSGLSNVVAIAAGGAYSLVLTGLPGGVAPPRVLGPQVLVGTADRDFFGRIVVANSAQGFGATGLPPGLAVDPATGLITGRPAADGTYAVTLFATNAVGVGQASLSLHINLPWPGITTSNVVLAGLGNGFAYSAAVNADWSSASGLPLGLAMDPQSAEISGVPLEAGDFVVSVGMSNRFGMVTDSFTLRVSPVVGWGRNTFGQTTIPSGLSNVVAIAAGGGDNVGNSLALTAEARLVGWGQYWNLGQYMPVTIPDDLTNVVAMASGYSYNLALTAEGRIVGLGLNEFGPTNIPTSLSNVVAIAAGTSHGLALTAEGRVVGWGRNDFGQTSIPRGLSNVVAIAAGQQRSLVLTAQGRVVGWGGGSASNVPASLSNVVAIAAGRVHSLALTVEGRVVEWSLGGTNNVLSNVVAIAAGEHHSLALTVEGRVVGWGWNSFGQTNVPTSLSNVVAIAGGEDHSLALIGLPDGVAAPRVLGPRVQVGTAGRDFFGRIVVANGAHGFGASGLPLGLTLDPATGLITGQPSAGGTYAVTLFATNALGVGQASLSLHINLPLPGISTSGLVRAVLGQGFSDNVGLVNEPNWVGASGLPLGLTFHPQSGEISGVPQEMGDFAVSVVVSNRFGVATGSFTLRVSPVVGWGGNSSGQTSIPSGLGNVVAVAAGGGHSLALTTEGRVVGWGWNAFGRTNIPTGLSNVMAIAAGGAHSLALVRPPAPRLTASRQGANLVLSWTGGQVPFQLQQCREFGSSAAWENVGEAVRTNSLSLPLDIGNLFLRVRAP